MTDGQIGGLLMPALLNSKGTFKGIARTAVILMFLSPRIFNALTCNCFRFITFCRERDQRCKPLILLIYKSIA